MTSGLQPGDMIVIAGRPSMGKTAFALNIAEHVGVELGLPVAIFSLEMSGPQIAMRFLSSVGRLDQHKVRTGRLSDEEWDKMTVALGKLHEAPIHIDETGAINATDLRARARRLHRQCGKLGLIVIDYLQLMTSTKRQARIAPLKSPRFRARSRRWPRSCRYPSLPCRSSRARSRSVTTSGR